MKCLTLARLNKTFAAGIIVATRSLFVVMTLCHCLSEERYSRRENCTLNKNARHVHLHGTFMGP